MSERLQDKIAVITGGAMGIGRAYCEEFAKQGANVIVADIDVEHASEVANKISSNGGSASSIKVDISDEASVRSMFQWVRETHNNLDVLINNAGILPRGDARRVATVDLSVAEWDRLMAVNLRGPFLCTRESIGLLESGTGGSIINVSSDTWVAGSANRVHYVVSKAGIVGLTRSLARELGPKGIRVNCISPGSTLSEETVTEDDMRGREAALAGRAIRRVELPEDLVGAAVFFASDESAFITGQTLLVNGGTMMQ